MSTTIPAPSTAPLPPAAVEALARLECRLSGQSVADTLAHEAGSYVRVTPAVQRAVARYEAATARYDELIARPASTLSPAEFDAFGDAQQAIGEALGVLADAGQLHLIEVA
ncbi:hypothetical protein OH540_09455 [Streptomyces sp. BPPL-273]|uniref:hypothetical protein n=1 Tax=Streptomyces sp. BPPL-273 TaxID=2987533 RepID=UPI0024AFA619|nr:hypothetical protein [Streptomyces sp. BPPL-273]WHM30248.1 hypothetical protein OH540_09455 [Streptomyces sp. BPPL-273]